MLLQWQQALPADKRGTLGKLDPFMMKELLVASNHEDTTYCDELLEGFPVTGAVEANLALEHSLQV